MVDTLSTERKRILRGRGDQVSLWAAEWIEELERRDAQFERYRVWVDGQMEKAREELRTRDVILRTVADAWDGRVADRARKMTTLVRRIREVVRTE